VVVKRIPKDRPITKKDDMTECHPDSWIEYDGPNWWHGHDRELSYCISALDHFYGERIVVSEMDIKRVRSIIKHAIDSYKMFNNGKEPKSIIEFGCITGYFAKEIMEQGYDYFGIDGSSHAIEYCHTKEKIPKENLLVYDLRKSLDLNKKFDLAICTEVVEHLEPPFAATIIETITKHSDYIWFSYADYNNRWWPEKRNHLHHPNEQPAIYWENLFDYFGYIPFDIRKYHIHPYDEDALEEAKEYTNPAFYTPFLNWVDNEKLSTDIKERGTHFCVRGNLCEVLKDTSKTIQAAKERLARERPEQFGFVE